MNTNYKIFVKSAALLPEFMRNAAIEMELSPFSSQGIQFIKDNSGGKSVFLYTGNSQLEIQEQALQRLLNVAADSGAGIVYSDYCQIKAGKRENVPVADYHEGCVRSDFDFGELLLLSPQSLDSYVGGNYKYAGLYDFRLQCSRKLPLLRLNEFLYTITENDLRLSGEKQFDYVNPSNREVQIEMEHAFTVHLKAIGAWLPPVKKTVDFSTGEDFHYEASVIIPVKNRVRTIADAVRSVLAQKTDFRYSLLVVDNHSDDGTSDILERFAAENENVFHIIPQTNQLKIGGCWNLAVCDERCGRFAVQLDSDDLYQDENTLQRIVDKFREEHCAMVIGSYTMTDFELDTIPPGLIDHAEWTDGNGHNNALRINGLGAPRAFYTPVLRKIGLPDTSYGEDYAVGLRICREYKIGRIFDSLYLCRRWGGNSDAALDIAAVNANNAYKDKLRLVEIEARKKNNAARQ